MDGVSRAVQDRERQRFEAWITTMPTTVSVFWAKHARTCEQDFRKPGHPYKAIAVQLLWEGWWTRAHIREAA